MRKSASDAPGGVLCAGNLVLDILVRPVELETRAFGKTTLVDSIGQHLGGNGASTSYTLARLGVPARLLGMVGDDPFGDYLLGKLRSAGVDTDLIARSRAATAATAGLVNSRGERLLLHQLGSSEEAFAAPIEFTAAQTAGMTYFHLATIFNLPLLRPRAAETLRRARAAGLVTSLDAQWDAAGRWLEDIGPCLPHCDLLFMNQDEARMLTGSTEPRRAAQAMLERGAGSVAIKLGRDGCAVFAKGEEARVAAFEVPVVDTTGAGDCFVGGFLCALLRGASFPEAGRFANAVAALSVQEVGAVEGLRSLAETREWMRIYAEAT